MGIPFLTKSRGIPYTNFPLYLGCREVWGMRGAKYSRMYERRKGIWYTLPNNFVYVRRMGYEGRQMYERRKGIWYTSPKKLCTSVVWGIGWLVHNALCSVLVCNVRAIKAVCAISYITIAVTCKVWCQAGGG